MADATAANQRQIIGNQRTILANQRAILANQKRIERTHRQGRHDANRYGLHNGPGRQVGEGERQEHDRQAHD